MGLDLRWTGREVSVQYQVLGPVVVTDGGVALSLGGFRQRAVLTVLLLSVDRTVDVDTLVENVWDGAPPAKPLTSLRAYVANLRRIIGADRLITADHGYRLRLGSDSLDSMVFESLAGRGRRLLDSGDPAAAHDCLSRALTLWQGQPLTDFRDSSWVQHEIQRLTAIRADTVESCYEAALLLGSAEELVAGLLSEIATYPMREQLWAQLMLALYRAGRRSDALAEYTRLCRLLDEELGVQPNAAVAQLAHDIRTESDALRWRVPTPRPAVRRPASGARIFGRTRELARLHDMLGAGTVAVLVGESGVGKTALAVELARFADELGMPAVWVGHAAGIPTPPTWAWSEVRRAMSPEHPTETAFPAQGFARVRAIADAVAGAVSSPSVIVLDDLHRADETTHQVLEFLAADAHRRPLFVLATWQDGAPDQPVRETDFDRMWGRSDVTVIRLRGLDDTATAQLIENISGLVPRSELVRSFEERTGGNPFYIKELARLLHENGHLNPATANITGSDVPDAVAGVIRRRTAALPAATRAVLDVAALLGGEFEMAVAAGALGLGERETVDRLDQARDAGLIVDAGPGRLRFGHGLVRDALAAQLRGPARTGMHAAIARAYAELGRTTFDHLLAAAEHAWRAHNALEPAAALAMVDRARSAAWSRSGYHQVAHLCANALEICDALPPGNERTDKQAELWLQLVAVRAVTEGQNSPALREALRNLGELRSQEGQFTLEAAFSCLEASGSGRYREAGAIAHALIALYADNAEPTAGSAGYYLSGLVSFFTGDIDAAATAVDIVVDGLPTVDWQRLGHLATFDVRGYGIGAWLAALRGDTAAVDVWTHRGIALADARNDVFGRAIVRISALQARAITGCHDGTAELADAVHTELREHGIDQLAASARVIGAWARALGPGMPDTADEVRDAIAEHAQDGTRIFLPMYYALLADVEKACGRLDIAHGVLESASSTAAATGERVWDAQLAARRDALRAAVAP